MPDDLDQPDDMGQTNDVSETGALIQTNSSGQTVDLSNTNGYSRRRRGSRRRSTQTSSYTPNYSIPDTNDRSGRPSYQNFRIVTERNIFDPNRGPGFTPNRGPRTRTDYFTLVGTMSYEKGIFAFFDGNNYAYQKALKLGESIADYKVTNITPNSVNIASGTNQVELRVGMQMRREDQGPWFASTASSTLANTSEPAATSRSSSDSGSSTASAPPGDENEILKRLRERREKE